MSSRFRERTHTQHTVHGMKRRNFLPKPVPPICFCEAISPLSLWIFANIYWHRVEWLISISKCARVSHQCCCCASLILFRTHFLSLSLSLVFYFSLAMCVCSLCSQFSVLTKHNSVAIYICMCSKFVVFVVVCFRFMDFCFQFLHLFRALSFFFGWPLAKRLRWLPKMSDTRCVWCPTYALGIMMCAALHANPICITLYSVESLCLVKWTLCALRIHENLLCDANDVIRLRWQERCVCVIFFFIHFCGECLLDIKAFFGNL